MLNRPNTTYVLTQDLDVPTRAFSFKSASANNITLDLNGHTITYDEGTPLVSHVTWSQYVYSDISTMGVYAYSDVNNIKILNGTIVQGRNNGTGDIQYGFNPIYVNVWGPAEVAGITTVYSGDDVGGIIGHESTKLNAHHNVLVDRGFKVTNRQAGIRAISAADTSDCSIDHNLIERSFRISDSRYF